MVNSVRPGPDCETVKWLSFFPRGVSERSDKFRRCVARISFRNETMFQLEQCITTSLGDTTPYKAIPELKALADRDSSQVFVPRALTETLEIALGGEQVCPINCLSVSIGLSGECAVE